MQLSAIASIIIEQGILGRILGCGTLIITGRDAGEVVIKWMVESMRVRREIESADYVEIAAA